MTKNRDISKILDQNTTFTATLSVGSGTANIFANSTILKIANSTVNTGIVVPTAAQYSGSYYLHANGTWQLVAAGATPGGANTQVQFNDSTALGGSAGFTFNKDTNNVVIANTLTVGASGNTINSTVWTGKAYTANDSTNLGGTAAASYQLNSTLAANVATLTANNATWLGTSIFGNTTGAYPTSNSVGAVLGNTISRVIITGNSATFISTLAAGDTTVTGFVNATTVVNSAAHTIGTTLIANTLGVYHTGIVNAASHTTTGFLANATHVVPTSNSSGQTFGNTISRWVMTANSLTVSGGASPDSNTLGTALGTTTQRWVALANTVTVSGGVSPDSNTLGTALGTTTQRWVITGNSATFTSTLAAGDTTITGSVNATVSVNSALIKVGTDFIANTLGAFHTGFMNASAFVTTGLLGNVTHLVPASNSSGHILGDLTRRWVITANSVTTSGGVSPDSNTLGTTLGSATQRWILTANSADIGPNFVANSLGAYHTATMNAAVFTTTGFRANVTHVVPTSNSSGQSFGNTISRWVITANSVTTSGGVSPDSNTLGTALGTTTQRWILLANTIETTGLANASALNVTNQVNTATLFATTSAAVGANVVANTTAALVGNSTFYVNVTSQAIKIANSTVNTGIRVPTAAEYAGSYYLHANGTWQSVAGAGSTHVYQAYTATGGQTTFTVSGGYTVNQIDVYENGIHLSNTEYTQDGTDVVLADGALAGELIEVVGYTSLSTFNPVASGSNTQIQYNDSGVPGGAVGFTYDETTNNVGMANTLTVGSSTVNTVANSTTVKLSNSTVNTAITIPSAAQYSGSYFLHANGTWQLAGGLPGGSDTYVQFNDGGASLNGTAGFTFSKSTNNVTIANTITVGANFIANSLGAYHTATINAAAFTTTGFRANATHVVATSNSSGQTLGNTISRWVITANSVTTSGGVSPDSNTLGTALGSATQRWVLLANTIESTGLANVSALNVVNQTNTATFFATTSANVGANVQANTTTIIVGNSTTNTIIGNNFINPGNTTANVMANSIAVVVANSTANTILSPVSLFAGNSTVNTTVNSVAIAINISPTANLTSNSVLVQLANSSGTSNLTPTSLAIATSLLANSLGLYPGSNTVGNLFGNTTARWDAMIDTIDISAGPVGNSSGLYPTSNSAGQNLGNTISRWILTANSVTTTGLVANASGLYPTSNTVGQLFGNTIARWDITYIGGSANSTGLYPISNTAGQAFGNTISRWVALANTVTTSGGVSPDSNTLGTALGTTTQRWVMNANSINLAPGTTTVAPLVFTSGTNLTSAAAGAEEFDGVQYYKTIDATSGRAAIPAEQYFHLTADGSTISTIANFFGTTSNISLVSGAHYIIDIYCFFLNTTAGTVTWTFTNSVAPTSQSILARLSPITGVVAAPGGTAERWGHVVSDATAARTYVDSGSLTDAVNHFANFKIFLVNSTGTNLKIQATKLVGGTITPRRNSWWFARRMSPSNIGTFAA